MAKFARIQRHTYRSPASRYLPHAVYEVLDDLGRVIYIGCSHDPRARVSIHRSSAKWRHNIHSYRVVQWYPNYTEAHDAERDAIKAQDPDHNFQNTELANLVSQTAMKDRRRVNAELRQARADRIAVEKHALRLARVAEGLLAA